MKVSVITVCFNSQATIQSCIQSVKNQDYPMIEHIFIDGGSTDFTINFIKENLGQFSQFLSESDDGIYDAMNKGLSLATGDVICFLNSDDQYCNDKVISTVVHEIYSNQLDALTSDVIFFRKNNPNKVIRKFDSSRFSPEDFSWGAMPAHPGLFLTKEVVAHTGFFKPSYKIAGDFDYMIRAFYKKDLKYKHLPKVTVKMMHGGISTMGFYSKVLLNIEMLRACRENRIKTNLLKLLSRYFFKLTELVNLH
jgi:glycosyltransferase involved in cell wall biosynthesis